MSDIQGEHDPTAAAAEDAATATPATTPLSELMAQGPKAEAAGKRGPDLDAAAVAAAQAAIAEGEAALAAAREQLAAQPIAPARPRREIALRLLLAANVVAMLLVALWPATPAPSPASPVDPTPTAAAPSPASPVERRAPPAAALRNDRYAQALLAAGNGDYQRAIALLEEHLAASPRMAPSQKINVLLALEHYSLQVGNPTAAQGFRARIQALHDSHSLPEDLVAMARAAVDNNDQESLRRIWARFLLQQRQVPTSLYKHVAEAYLQLGDSYRLQANDAAEQQRLQELQQQAERMRKDADEQEQRR